MTSQEAAMTFASASAKCQRDKCPYHKECNGFSDQCKLKDVALILRDQDAQIELLNAKIDELNAVIESLKAYEHKLEKVIKKLRNAIASFKLGKKPRYKAVKGGRRVIMRRPRKKKPEEMDGDERYAQPGERLSKPDPPLVII